MTTLHVRIEPEAAFDDRVREKLRALDDGAAESLDGESILTVPDEDALGRVLSGRNLELVRTIARDRPASLRELARRVDRDIKNVSRNVNELAELGLVELEPNGRAKRPRVPYDELEVTYPLREDSDDSLASV